MSLLTEKTRNSFGRRSLKLRHMSSTDWEAPMYGNSGDPSQFAAVTNTENKFEAKIDLNCFSQFKPEEIEVNVHGYDLLINCRKEDPKNPNMSLATINRQYRLPDDTDLATVRLQRNNSTKQVKVAADKVNGYGKAVMLNVCTAIGNNRKVIGGL